MNFRVSLPTFLVTVLLTGVVVRAAEGPQGAVDYVKQIKPILTEHCAGCHGADEQESGLRLDAGSLVVRGGDRGAAVIPGKSEQSLLYQVLVGQGEVSAMPLDGDPLHADEIALIKRWIDEGAKFPKEEAVTDGPQSDHWAFQPVRRPPVPAVQHRQWLRNEIDAFILARLEDEGLRPSPPADRVTLIRRLSLDLIGLPPTPEEVDRFLADTEPGAYERLVDHLLASPHFGERWGRYWLDVARYADSNGFTIDGARSIWKYRDWVIDALNRDLPFDQFTIEQLAGDMLPHATTQQIVATGFHRNTLINQEGGTSDEQFRVEAVVDRVNTTGSVFLGLTVGCAQCHVHKYDPITQRDFYRLYAIFNNCEDENDKTHSTGRLGPLIRVPSPKQAAELKTLDTEIAAVEKTLAQMDRKYARGQAAWERQLAVADGPTWTVLDPREVRSEGGATVTRLDDGSYLVGGMIPDHDVYTITADVPLETITAVRLEALTHESLPNTGPGLTPHGNFTLSEFEVQAGPPARAMDEDSELRPIRIAQATADHSQQGGPIAAAVDGNVETFWGIYGDKAVMNANHEAVFTLESPVRHAGGARLTVKMTQKYSRPRYAIGRFRLAVTGASQDVLALPESTRKLLEIPPEKRSAKQKQQLATLYAQTNPERRPHADRLASLEKRRQQVEKAVPTTMVLKERETPRETHIQIRGDYLRLGARVYPGVPEVLPPIPGDPQDVTRLDFARWLVQPENPLTSRVTVNRFWQRLFGLGIVETESDFGTQGIPPTHPKLLDWLADEFMQRGWSVKSMLKLIVMSATYRQSSHVGADLLERDPTNKLLARQSRIRLDAEAVRDACLVASGLLSRKMHGPSVFPPQPEGIYALTQTNKNWKADTDEDRYRRGLYIYFWRSSPYPFLTTFDAPDATTACTRRNRSNTPLQALTLANAEAFFELAQGLASRILHEAPEYDEGRIRHGFRVCLSREPSESELQRLDVFLDGQREHFQKAAEEAQAAAPDDYPDGVSVAEAASWTAVARVLMNLDEFITRE